MKSMISEILISIYSECRFYFELFETRHAVNQILNDFRNPLKLRPQPIRVDCDPQLGSCYRTQKTLRSKFAAAGCFCKKPCLLTCSLQIETKFIANE